MVLVWQTQQLATLSAALDEARQGTPTVVAITGDAGAGKSMLLNELIEQASDFVVLSAEGTEDDRMPFTVLTQWGVATGETIGAEPFIVAQDLRRRIDSYGDQPLILKLDDLHWADRESVDALVWVLRRSIGDRLLVAVTSRPLSADQHPGWQRWLASRSTQVARIDLTGLSGEQLDAMLAEAEITLPASTAAALLEHTGGNPLYLQALLQEYDADELGSNILPAPAALASAVAARTERLSGDASTMLAATAVLGAGWQPFRLVTTLAGVDHPTAALDELVESGLVHVRQDAVDHHVRVEHALVHSAVYRSVSLSDRQRLHDGASRLVEDESAALDHRVSASDELDAELADDLEAYALRLRERRAWSQAAYYFRASATRTPADDEWRRRLLDAAFASGLVPDLAAMGRDLDRIPVGTTPLEQVTRGFHQLRLGEWETGIGQLSDLLDRRDVPEQVRYRAAVLAAWAMLELDRPPGEVDRLLAIADASPAPDGALEFHHRSTRTFTDQDLLTPTEHWDRLDASLSGLGDVPLSRSWELAQRAIVAVRIGRYDVARDDLAELMRRGQSGQFAGWDARVPAGLGYVQWMLGEWAEARVSLAIANEASGHAVYLPLMLIGDGRMVEAYELLGRMGDRVRAEPHDVLRATYQFSIIMAAHAEGDRAEQRRMGMELAPQLADDLRHMAGQSRSAILACGIAAFWARRADLLATCASELETARPDVPWGPAVAHWFLGLAAEVDGDRQAVRTHLAAAARDPRMNLPLFKAHILVDLAETCGVLGDFSAATEALDEAKQIYADLGATTYLRRIAGGWPPEAQAPARRTPAIKITERERDVLALALAGMSYAQIAQQLFITQKTVGYHLSNLYAKAHVSGRHQLTQLAREDPGLFELDADTSAA